MNMLNVLVADDDLYTLKVLGKLISESPHVDEVFLASDGETTYEIAKKENIHIAFLDIDMPKLDGLECSKLISHLGKEVKIVFITAYPDYALESYEVKALDYILKPIDFKRVIENISQIAKESEKTKVHLKDKNILMIKEKSDFHFINLSDIHYIETNEKHLIIHTSHGEYQTRMPISEIHEKLNDDFIRSHKSYLINIKNIKSFQAYTDSSYLVFFKDLEEDKNALITKDRLKQLNQSTMATF